MEIGWYGDNSSIRDGVLGNFELYQIFKCYVALNLFLIYLLGQNFPKKLDKKKLLNYIKSSCIISCTKMTRCS